MFVERSRGLISIVFPRTLFLKLAVYICRNSLQFRSIPYSGIYKCCYSLFLKTHTHTHNFSLQQRFSNTTIGYAPYPIVVFVKRCSRSNYYSFFNLAIVAFIKRCYILLKKKKKNLAYNSIIQTALQGIDLQWHLQTLLQVKLYIFFFNLAIVAVIKCCYSLFLKKEQFQPIATFYKHYYRVQTYNHDIVVIFVNATIANATIANGPIVVFNATIGPVFCRWTIKRLEHD